MAYHTPRASIVWVACGPAGRCLAPVIIGPSLGQKRDRVATVAKDGVWNEGCVHACHNSLFPLAAPTFCLLSVFLLQVSGPLLEVCCDAMTCATNLFPPPR